MNSENKTNVNDSVEEDIIQQLEDFGKMFDEQLTPKYSDYTAKNILISNLPHVYDMLVDGEPIAHICNKLGISRNVWYDLKKNSPAFCNMLAYVEQEQIDNARSSLVKKTRDRYVEDQKVLGDGRIVKYNKYVPADNSSLKFYLLNKAPEEYKEKQTVVVEKPEIVIDLFDDEVSEKE